MTEPDFQLLGALIREVRADMRTIRSENALLRRDLVEKADHKDLTNVMAAISDRISRFEVMLEQRLDQTERSIEERLTRIEEKVTHA